MSPQEHALPLLRLQQDELAVGKLGRKRNPGRTAARADVDDRPVLGADEREPA